MYAPEQRITAGNNRIEGKLEKGQKVVVIEDLISTGGSVIEVVECSERGRSRSARNRQHIYIRHEERALTGLQLQT